MGAIFRREIGAYFTSSVAYIFLAVFWIFSGFFFFQSCLSLATTDMSALFQSMFLICIFVIPLLTMRSFSEEKKQKTEQGLLTAPVSLGEIVFGKYFAALDGKALMDNGYQGVSLVSRKGQKLAKFFKTENFIANSAFIEFTVENNKADRALNFYVKTYDPMDDEQELSPEELAKYEALWGDTILE
jgi:ABC-2 type transport system permease protein